MTLRTDQVKRPPRGQRTTSMRSAKSGKSAVSAKSGQSVVSFDIPALPVRHNFEAKLTWYRWPILLFFICNISAMSCMALSMSPQSALLKAAYGVGTQEVNMCSTIFSATYIPMTFFTMWLYSKLPCHYVIRTGCFLFVTGAWVRLISAQTGNFYWILIG